MIHEPGCDCGSYGCELRAKGLRFSSKAIGVKGTQPFRPKVNCSWEAGVSGERRVDGSFMPYVDARGRKIHVKEAGERRRELQEIRAHQVAGPPKE